MGSTIVLVFEAPREFEFAVRQGQRVKVGEKLGDVKDGRKVEERGKKQKEGMEDGSVMVRSKASRGWFWWAW